ncbi:MAG TPA: helix-turn-helix domain-containing protein [Acidobacteriota bacterium]|nr:helix-turn-helix domain-containing protein [Acidobacteriota bacterium]
MSDSERYSIAELEETTGQPRRTIHHYISRGLLPKAEGSGPKAYYTREHFLRLRLITLLVEAGVGTDLIQGSLERWSMKDMEHLVSLAEGKSLDDLDKLSRWLNRADLPSETSEEALMPSQAIAHDLAEWQEAQFLQKKSTRPRPVQQSMHLGYSSAPPASAASSSPRASLPRPDRWERIRVGNDVEIAYRAKSDRSTRRKIQQLEELVAELFADELADEH